eukprot:s3054_g5.t1
MESPGSAQSELFEAEGGEEPAPLLAPRSKAVQQELLVKASLKELNYDILEDDQNSDVASAFSEACSAEAGIKRGETPCHEATITRDEGRYPSKC